MLISAKTTRRTLIFFSPKEAQLLFRQLQKLSAQNIAALKCESRKTKCWVPWNPPLMQLSVLKSQIFSPYEFAKWNHFTVTYWSEWEMLVKVVVATVICKSTYMLHVLWAIYLIKFHHDWHRFGRLNIRQILLSWDTCVSSLEIRRCESSEYLV